MPTVRCTPMEMQLDAVDYADAMLYVRRASQSVDVDTTQQPICDAPDRRVNVRVDSSAGCRATRDTVLTVEHDDDRASRHACACRVRVVLIGAAAVRTRSEGPLGWVSPPPPGLRTAASEHSPVASVPLRK